MKIDWKRLYRSFDAELSDFDCGTLCAPVNGGVPSCCQDCEPVLYRKELAWVKKKTDLWGLKPLKTKKDRRKAEEIEDYICYARCGGVRNCDRNYRSLCCRFFPLEPYFDKKDRFAGLTYIYRLKKYCPVIGNEDIAINQRYVDQAIAVWREILCAYPREVETYIEESRKLRKKFKKKKRTIMVFEASGS